MSDAYEEVIRRYYHNIFGTHKMDNARNDQFLVEDFLAHDLRLHGEGRQGYMQFISMLAASFSEIQPVVIHDIFRCEDRVATRWSWTGKHTAEFMGIPATHRRILIKGIDIFHMTEQKISNLWQEIDFIGLLQQISSPPADATDDISSLEEGFRS